MYPPRPKTSVPPSQLPYYERQDRWCVQPKYNGHRVVIHIKNGKIKLFNRHNEQNALSLTLFRQLLALPGLNPNLEYWLDGEILLKTAAKDTKGKIVLFDVLHAGQYLYLKPDQMGRLALLKEICGLPTQLDPWRGMAWQVSPDLLLAPTYTERFAERFNTLTRLEEVEGLVLRRRASSLDHFGQSEYHCNWLIRCRRSDKNVRF